MSLRQAFRSKIKDVLHGSDRHGYHNISNDDNGSKDETEATATKPIQSSTHGLHEMGEVADGSDPCPSTDLEVYETQLNQLQEHLVAAMLENQQLDRELSSYKDDQTVTRLQAELESERERNKQLEEDLCLATNNISSSSAHTLSNGDGKEHEEGVTEKEDVPSLDSATNPRRRGWVETATDCITRVFYDVISDFTEDADPAMNAGRNSDDLTVKGLRDSVTRFKSTTGPIFDTASDIKAILSWKMPAFSFLAFLIYMYLVWTGYLLPVFLFLAIFRLGANYLRERGWNVNVMYLPSTSTESSGKDSEEGSSTSVTDKVTIVLQVAKTVQNTLNSIADNLEKIKSLLTWKHPAATRYLLTGLCAALSLTIVLPATTFFRLAGLYLGIKLFIIDTMYETFPRFRQRRDTVYRYWGELPTDSEVKDRKRTVDDMASSNGHSSRHRHESDDGRAFCESFFLPLNEKPIPEWRSGWRCIHIDREKSLTAAIKPGKLYLTHSFLCFARHNPHASTNIKIRLTDITSIKKVKPYSWMPGKGKSIEITLADCEKPHLFGAIFGRDDCYKSIMCHGRQVELSWAGDTNTVSAWSGRTERGHPGESSLVGSLSPRSYRLSELQSEDEQGMIEEETKDDDSQLYIGNEL